MPDLLRGGPNGAQACCMLPKVSRTDRASVRQRSGGNSIGSDRETIAKTNHLSTFYRRKGWR
ncbi:hypothetical protein Pla175_23490 [Pirellulimonas nuda]|uniref:Uncharacterized protein n=1 Tax=Pirellulimonas nuda TaxID=2528009 RepID=A0A518DBV8_9BACT|nr:hypothetical protein [Pirellulimonas nuda]QDU88965.1 hypothetical protein Pla175_23490 [Pirellulimonas nuda]